jgi:membrane protease YdiL (CAAX protease family)
MDISQKTLSSDDHRLGLRVLGVFVLLYLAVWATTLVLGVGPNMLLRTLGVAERRRILIGSTISRSGALVVTVILSAWALRRVTGLDAWEVMFPLRPGWQRDLLFGLGLAAGVMGLLFAVERAAGWLTIEGWRWQTQSTAAWLQTAWLALLANLLAAIGEEAMFRGYLLTGLKRAWGRTIGLAVMAVLFGLPHLLVTGAAETPWLLFTLLLALPGLMLGWAYLRSGDLWLPVGVHFAWNLVQGDLLNLTGASGGTTLFGLLTRQQGPAWFVGTSYGIEVGLAGLLGLLIVVAGVWAWTDRFGRGESEFEHMTDCHLQNVRYALLERFALRQRDHRSPHSLRELVSRLRHRRPGDL